MIVGNTVQCYPVQHLKVTDCTNELGMEALALTPIR